MAVKSYTKEGKYLQLEDALDKAAELEVLGKDCEIDEVYETINRYDLAGNLIDGRQERYYIVRWTSQRYIYEL